MSSETVNTREVSSRLFDSSVEMVQILGVLEDLLPESSRESVRSLKIEGESIIANCRKIRVPGVQKQESSGKVANHSRDSEAQNFPPEFNKMALAWFRKSILISEKCLATASAEYNPSNQKFPNEAQIFQELLLKLTKSLLILENKEIKNTMAKQEDDYSKKNQGQNNLNKIQLKEHISQLLYVSNQFLDMISSELGIIYQSAQVAVPEDTSENPHLSKEMQFSINNFRTSILELSNDFKLRFHDNISPELNSEKLIDYDLKKQLENTIESFVGVSKALMAKGIIRKLSKEALTIYSKLVGITKNIATIIS
ncbi:hypothetical protein AYI68_g1241 [Smittium mucronatum]|uniref:Uncharacterized protein n=1 Tax=Smittium mucronatum TaxID=133383 RepID=A0A1R0H651_9FUNG|nr:hypothetical protein AYI68_g6281 [Smittium mucronatum]OLY84593.1 hypothetical protein AYI68_g1241 [Smittium mucronatum]